MFTIKNLEGNLFKNSVVTNFNDINELFYS